MAPHRKSLPLRRKYTDQQFIEAVESSQSMRLTLKKLGLQPAGGNYSQAKTLIAALGLSTSHWLGKAIHRGKTLGHRPQRLLSEVLAIGSDYNRGELKKRLIREGLLKPICAICDINSWLGNPLVLHLDHKNGVHNDNRLSNLRLLCPNCHSQTETYAGKNCGARRGSRTLTP